MLGAMVGDIVGSRFEFSNYKGTDFELFHPDCKITDDSVCTVAVADWILQRENGKEMDFSSVLQRWCLEYPYANYGCRFSYWIENPKPYGSFGNGAAMRISPVGDFYQEESEILKIAQRVTAVSHDSLEGIKGAQAVALAQWMARMGTPKSEIRKAMETRFGYDLDFTVEERRKVYEFDPSCQGTVPEALVAFLESNDFEEAIRLAVSLGGDSDTLACITGGIAESYYRGVPDWIVQRAMDFIPDDMKSVIRDFYELLGTKTANPINEKR